MRVCVRQTGELGGKEQIRDDCRELGRVGPVGKEGLVQPYLFFCSFPDKTDVIFL